MTRSWRLRDRSLAVDGKPLVMGILNVTPDSFSDGGRFAGVEVALERARDMEREGADVIDVGGESTRPGAAAVPASEEARRVVPIVRALAEQSRVPIGVDTRKAEVAQEALKAGASIVNDVSALGDPRMADIVREASAGLVLMHMQGDPATMQRRPHYEDVVAQVREYLVERARHAEEAGIARDAIALDPGLGFGKRTGAGVEDNLVLLRRLDALTTTGYPVLVGASRKSFVGNALSLSVDQRLEGSLAAAAVAVWNGASIVRVHDVAPTRRVVDLVHAVRNA